MVTIVRRRRGTKDYYYLHETVRQGRQVTTREQYLGSKIPSGIEERKREFRLSLLCEQWMPRLERVGIAYRRQRNEATPSVAAKALEEFAIRFTYDTQRIEGSTLSLRQTADLLEHGVTPSGKPVADVKEAEAHRALFRQVLAYRKDLAPQALFEWHRRLFLSTKPDIAGRFRRHGVRISGSRFEPPSPVEVDPLMADFFAWYRRTKDRIHPVERAALAHLKFVTIHPFADGNGRLGRLLMNFVLHRARWPLLNIPYGDRSAYYRSLERSQTQQEDVPFLRWFFREYVAKNGSLPGVRKTTS